MRSNEVFAQNAIKKVSNLQINDQVDVLDQSCSHLNVWSADIPIASL